MDFTGRRVLVTGASRGIGRAVAIAFAARGARVAVHFAAREDAARETLAALGGSGHVLARGDLTDPVAVRAMVDGAAADLGGIDVLVNNAGVYELHPVIGGSYEEWQASWARVLGVNLIGAANVTWCAAQHMAAAGGGRIVNVSSRGAFRGEPEAPSYGASKGGLNSFGQSLARALAPHGIVVSTVAPGFVETDMAADLLEGAAGDAIRAQSPLGRVARPEEVAHAVLYLASDGAQFSTGAILDLNGASYLRT